MVTPDARRPHVLTVALEDYFQVGAFNSLIQQRQWHRFETRFEQNTERALALLDRFGVKATFFVLGWIAERYPEVVRQVAERGHEIASKGYYHRSIRQMSPSEFRDDLQRAREALERAGGKKVIGYRVAHEWFTPGDLWALEVLAREGYAYDSSIGPLGRRFAREPYRRFLHEHVSPGGRIWEVPLSSWSVLGCHVPIAGGNYFRQFPHTVVKHLVDHWDRHYTAPFVMYFHVWELDRHQPQITAAPLLRRIRHYRNLGKMSWVLAHYLSTYRFTGIAQYLGLQQAAVPALPGPRPVAAPARVAPTRRALSLRTPVTVVVPCYNEALVLPYLARTLDALQDATASSWDLRFVFVDDCSGDDTWRMLRDLFGARTDCTLVRHEQNRGAAAAILTGVRQATTEIVCSIDCDCTYDPLELTRMVPLLADGVALVTGSPYHASGGVRNVPALRLFLSRTASFLYRRVLPVKLATYTSFFRVYRRSAVVDLPLRETGFLGVAELVGLLALRGARIVEYPTVLEVRILGRSKIPKLKTILGHLGLLARFARARRTRVPEAPREELPRKECA
jgi:polysaccharide deacetylase family protein (PEP-CTERM system associated)